MNPWNLFAGGAAIGLVAGLWDKIKAVAWRALNLFVQQIEIPSRTAHEAVVSHLVAHYQRSRAYDRLYGAHYEHHRDGRYGLVPYEEFGRRSMIFWNGLFPFLFANAQEKKTKPANAGNSGNSYYDYDMTKVYSTITFIRGTLDVERILRDACLDRNALNWQVADAGEATKSRFRIHYVPPRSADDSDWEDQQHGLAWYQLGSYRLLAHSPEQLGKAPAKGRALDQLIFPPRVKALIREIELWRTSQRWYADRGLPWKRGWLLYGPPGTGKTALARAFAEDLNLPITVFSLGELSNRQLARSWAAMQANVPCIALFEDIDNVFHGRENVARRAAPQPLVLPPANGDKGKQGKTKVSEPVTFDCLLNCLDGVERADGIFTIITTNDIAKIDPALGQPRTLPDGSVEFISTRPGRVDKAVELGYMEPADKKRLAKRILGDYPDEYLTMLEFIDEHPDLPETPAQFQERCGQIALACFWDEERPVQRADPVYVSRET
jgi:hypothetical protein